MLDVATPRERPYQRVTRLIGIVVLAPLLAVAILPVSVHILQAPNLGFMLHNLTIQNVQPEGPAAVAGLAADDRLTHLDGQPIDSMDTWFAALAGHYGLEPRRIVVERDGRRLAALVQPRRPDRAGMVSGLGIWLAGLAFLMIGWWVLTHRRDEVARDFFALSLIFAFFLADVPDLPSVKYQAAKQIVREVLQYLWPAYFLRFLLLFPALNTARGGDSRHWVFVPAVVLAVLTLVARLIGLDEEAALTRALGLVAQIYLLVYFVAGLAVFARKVLRRDRPILHTKLRVILLGVVLGIAPFLAAIAAGSGFVPEFPRSEYLGFSLLLIPASFGLAIMRYGALDTGFVIRTSLVYGLVTLLVVAGYLLAVGTLGHFVARMYQVSALPVLVVVIVASTLAVLPLRRRVQGWVDATLYPSRRANRETVAELGRDLALQTTTDDAYQLLLGNLDQLYRPEKLVLYLAPDPDADHFEDVDRRPPERRPGPDLRRDDPVLTFLDRLRRPVFAEEFEDWIISPGEQRKPTDIPLSGATLLVPLVTGNRLVGLLLWGDKTDQAFYSQDDLANLARLSLQVAPVLESLRLHDESLRRRQMETELAVARDIQDQLLPHQPLELGGVCVVGRNEPCRHVGGDYFDYFPLSDRSLGFCIADVAGKGIPAALMMSTLRVTFRELAQPDTAPEAVIATLDRRLGAVATAGRFVCFFYGVLDLDGGVLAYCNAGMEPPLLVRADGQREELRRGGPIIGIGAGVPYRRGTTQFGAGDLLLGYTDGITEQTSPDGAEFFEVARLHAMVTESRNLGPEDLCGRIFTGVDAFGGREASDDRTVIAMKYC